MKRGQLQVLESLLSLFFVLISVVLALKFYCITVEGLDIEKYELKYALLSSIMELDEMGILSDLLSRLDLSELHSIVCLLLGEEYEVRIVVLDEDGHAFSIGSCSRPEIELAYLTIAEDSSIYEVRVFARRIER